MAEIKLYTWDYAKECAGNPARSVQVQDNSMCIIAYTIGETLVLQVSSPYPQSDVHTEYWYDEYSPAMKHADVLQNLGSLPYAAWAWEFSIQDKSNGQIDDLLREAVGTHCAEIQRLLPNLPKQS